MTSRLHLVIWLALAVACLTTGHAGSADKSAPATVRIGILGIGAAPLFSKWKGAFLEPLQSFGYVEGRNLFLETRWANGDLSRLPDLAEDLVRLNVAIIVATTTYDVRAAKRATASIPIVMVTSADPVSSGLVADLARPKGNVTGMSLMTIELTTKRLQILKDVLPRAARIAVLWNPDHPFHSQVVAAIKAIAPSLSIQPIFVAARTPHQLPLALSAAKRARADALCVIEDPFFYLQRAAIAKLASKERIPAIYGARDYAEVGGLMSYGPNYEDLWRRAAGYVHKILQGAKPSDLPIEQPTKFELVVNFKAAKELDLRMSNSVLVQATEVIK